VLKRSSPLNFVVHFVAVVVIKCRNRNSYLNHELLLDMAHSALYEVEMKKVRAHAPWNSGNSDFQLLSKLTGQNGWTKSVSIQGQYIAHSFSMGIAKSIEAPPTDCTGHRHLWNACFLTDFNAERF